MLYYGDRTTKTTLCEHLSDETLTRIVSHSQTCERSSPTHPLYLLPNGCLPHRFESHVVQRLREIDVDNRPANPAHHPLRLALDHITDLDILCSTGTESSHARPSLRVLFENLPWRLSTKGLAKFPNKIYSLVGCTYPSTK